MSIPTLQYKGYALRAYAQRTLPLYRDPYAAGPHRYASVVRIDAIPPGEGIPRRYQAEFKGTDPTTDVDAPERAMQYARDIVDGKVQPQML
ncbi:MAG TPA: hypothetical protein VEC01_08310 [Noviherbaspirillum sp.]|uniref:hypothetical protein n=1 Tax=Noviherbaspirillum sp. TaxID=1926288 RepID=UPI002D607E2E|nr:hypothetical protein [Noviherbaspirillum sp.]HYD95314.1 hypothetical protein [Noviherbaspirillum sp.]